MNIKGSEATEFGRPTATHPSGGTQQDGGKQSSMRHGKVPGKQTGVGGSTSPSIKPAGDKKLGA